MPEEINKDLSNNDENETTESVSIEPVIPKVRSQFLAVLKIRNFMIFSLSQSVSLFGDKLDYMALLAMIAFFCQQIRMAECSCNFLPLGYNNTANNSIRTFSRSIG